MILNTSLSSINSIANPISLQTQGSENNAPIHSESILWKKINFEYLNELRRSHFSDEFYEIAPEILEPLVPLKESLEIVVFQKKSPRMKKAPQNGLSGKVKFVRFKNDPDKQRWVAIKRPSSLASKILQADNVKVSLKKYENNFKIAERIGNHPNFMKIYGIVVKEIKKGEDTKAKPYLILEYIEGVLLGDLEEITWKNCLPLLYQLKNALMHLYKCRILPRDANFGNFLITAENRLVLIDFDAWQSDVEEMRLVRGLFEVGRKVASRLSEDPDFADIDLKQNLNSNLDLIIKQFCKKNPLAISKKIPKCIIS